MKTLLFVLLGMALIGCGNRTLELPPDSPKARYLLFPRGADARKAGRAILVNGDELANHDPITYYTQNTPGVLPRNQLSLLPDDMTNLEPYIDQLNREIKSWAAETDIGNVSFSLSGDRAELTVYFLSGDRVEYRYTIQDAHTPTGVSCYSPL